MNMQTVKMITVKFEKMSDADETALRAFLTRELAQKQARYDEPDTDAKKRRETFRVKLNNVRIRVITEATAKVPQQEIDVLLDDISVGGCCIGLSPSTPVAKGGTIYLTLHFCQPSISVRGTVLGLKAN
jgi:c-di-GMP-binding flagellar brake protein YcgR